MRYWIYPSARRQAITDGNGNGMNTDTAAAAARILFALGVLCGLSENTDYSDMESEALWGN